MSMLIRITIAEDISELVDLKSGESRWYEEVRTVQPGTAFSTPELLEEYAVLCSTPMTGPDRWYDANGEAHPMEPYVPPETFVMAHFTEDL